MNTKNLVISGILAVLLSTSCTKETVKEVNNPLSPAQSSSSAELSPESGLDASPSSGPAQGILTTIVRTDNRGDRTGSGGDGLVCFNSKGEIETVKVWDYVEAEAEHGLQINLGEASLSYQEKMNLVVERIMSHEREVESGKFDDLFSFNSLFNVIGQGANSNEFVKLVELENNDAQFVLREISDDNSRIALAEGSNCKIAQLAMQEDMKRDGRSFIKIHKKLWDKMDNDHKAGLLLHELFLLHQRREALEESSDTRNARYMNVAFSTTQYDQIENDKTNATFLSVLASTKLLYRFSYLPYSLNFDNGETENAQIIFTGYMSEAPSGYLRPGSKIVSEENTVKLYFNELTNTFEQMDHYLDNIISIESNGMNSNKTNILENVQFHSKFSTNTYTSRYNDQLNYYGFSTYLEEDFELEHHAVKNNGGKIVLQRTTKNIAEIGSRASCKVTVINDYIISGVLKEDLVYQLKNGQIITLVKNSPIYLDQDTFELTYGHLKEDTELTGLDGQKFLIKASQHVSFDAETGKMVLGYTAVDIEMVDELNNPVSSSDGHTQISYYEDSTTIAVPHLRKNSGYNYLQNPLQCY